MTSKLNDLSGKIDKFTNILYTFSAGT